MCSQRAHSSVESLPALGALDDDPLVRHAHGGMVLGDVSGARSELKVVKAVVVLDLVAVVDVLVRAESAPKMLLHDEAMLEDVEAVAGELHIPV